MRHYGCGGEYKRKSGTLKLHDNSIGDYLVQNADYYKCEECGELMFRGSMLRVIEAKEDEIRKRLIKRLPIEEFISASEVAKILGKSRQAIHKHRRIRRGFIYSIDFEGRKVYHKKSVELYRKTGDGRFPLSVEKADPEIKYVIVNQTSSREEPQLEEIIGTQNLYHWFKKSNCIVGHANG